MKKTLLVCSLLASLSTFSQSPNTAYKPNIEGTVRAKYEYNSSRYANRFQVRNARFSVNGKVSPIAYYKAEIDLSDKGTTKMLDAYVQLRPLENLSLTIGQQRIPFGNDVLRSPHQLLFANRSFIAKQMSSGLRDVGAMISYSNKSLFPMEFKGGIYNGKGITEQENWEKKLSIVLRSSFKPISAIDINLGYFTFHLPQVQIQMYNISSSFKIENWHLEAEYTCRTYNNSIAPTHAFSSFIAYNIFFNKQYLNKISPLLRFDRMTDSNNGEFDEVGKLKIVDHTRSRITGGLTFSLDKPFLNDIRLNYEQYFYANNIKNKDNKLVLEFVVRF